MKKNKQGIVYSTNPNYQFEIEQENIISLKPEEQILNLHLEKKSGKYVVIIKNFKGSNDELKKLGKTLKKSLSVGGTVKNNEIILQGNVRDDLIVILNKFGYKFKKVGG